MTSTLRKRGNVWFVRYYLDGKRYELSLKTNDEDVAKAKQKILNQCGVNDRRDLEDRIYAIFMRESGDMETSTAPHPYFGDDDYSKYVAKKTIKKIYGFDYVHAVDADFNTVYASDFKGLPLLSESCGYGMGSLIPILGVLNAQTMPMVLH
jgi:hypothetical protein